MGLTVQNLSAGYGRTPLLSGISFSAARGEVVVLLAPNGSGKTTLLRALSGDLPLLSGAVAVDGMDLATLPTRRRASLLTRMPQEIPAAAGLTGADFIALGLYPMRGAFARVTNEDCTRIQALAERFDAAYLLPRDLGEMSVGERQMISLLRAAVQNTPVLLLDEPVSALDFGNTERLLSLVRALSDDGRTILAVLHDPTLALRHGTRLLTLSASAPRTIAGDFDLTDPDTDAIEHALQAIYPALRLHRDPLFCYTDPSSTKFPTKE